MKIAIDIDDTLTDTFDYLMPFVAEYFGEDPEELRRKNISYSNLPPEWRDRERDFCRKYFDGMVEDTPFKPDAAWGVAELRRRGHRVVIITARTAEFYTDPYATTCRELEKGGIVYDKLVCTLDKAAACREEGIGILIDDLPANCAAVQTAGVQPILFESRANRKEKAPWPLARNWEQAVRLVEELEKEI